MSQFYLVLTHSDVGGAGNDVLNGAGRRRRDGIFGDGSSVLESGADRRIDDDA